MTFAAYRNNETRKLAAVCLYTSHHFDAGWAQSHQMRYSWEERTKQRFGEHYVKSLDFKTIAKALDKALGID